MPGHPDQRQCTDATGFGTGCRLTPKEREEGYHLACRVALSTDAEFTIPVESRIDSPQILVTQPAVSVLSSRLSRGTRWNSRALTACLLPRSQDRFTGYTGLRPRITDEQYHALLASETPLAAILSTLRAPPTGTFDLTGR